MPLDLRGSEFELQVWGLLPAVQADLAVNNLYVYQERPPLPVPITVVGGRVDPYVTAQHLTGWRAHTGQAFQLHMRPGDHYFIERERAFLVDLVARVAGAGPVPAGLMGAR